MKSKSPPPLPQSFDERLSRVPLWTLIPAVFLPVIAWDLLESYFGLSAIASRRVGDMILWTFSFGWWLLKAAPRPYSLRASLGRPLDLAGWRFVAWAMFGVTSVRIIWWIIWYCRDIFQIASASGAYTFKLPHTHVDAFFVLNAAVLPPLIEELLFRATIFRNCRVRFSPTMAALLSSALFGLAHSDSMAVFISALAYVLAYSRTRSLWAPIALHVLNNGGWLALSKYYLGDSPQVRLEGRWQFALFALVLLVGAGAWLQFLRRNWRTLGDALPPDSLLGTITAHDSSLPEPLRVAS